MDALKESGTDLDQLKSSIHQVLSVLKTSATELLARNKEPYSGDQPVLRLISPLAEGADRLAAEVALGDDLKYDLQCPLPFDRDEYERDFKPANRRRLSVLC